MSRVTIAYEPVWAIGTGKTATASDAQKAHRAIRQHLAAMYDDKIANAIRIQYGGSVKAANAAELFAQPDIDGGLIGGASLKANELIAIIEAAAHVSVTPTQKSPWHLSSIEYSETKNARCRRLTSRSRRTESIESCVRKLLSC